MNEWTSFRVLTPCRPVGGCQHSGSAYSTFHVKGTFSPEDGDSVFLYSVGVYLKFRSASKSETNVNLNAVRTTFFKSIWSVITIKINWHVTYDCILRFKMRETGFGSILKQNKICFYSDKYCCAKEVVTRVVVIFSEFKLNDLKPSSF
jgi:hypothetical protein